MRRAITSYHDYIAAAVVNHPDRQYRFDEKSGSIVEANWARRAVRALFPSKRLAEDIVMMQKLLQWRNEIPRNAPFSRLGIVSFDFTNVDLKRLDNQLRCVEQQVVLTNRAHDRFFYAFGDSGRYLRFDSWRDAAKLFYPDYKIEVNEPLTLFKRPAQEIL